MKILFLFIFLIMAPALAQVGGVAPAAPVEMWPDKVWNEISREVDRSGTQLANVIFDLIDEFKASVWKSGDLKAKVAIRRRVFDNQDILNSFTVNDQFQIELGRNSTEYSIPLTPSIGTSIDFKLGVSGKLQVNHIRQVLSTAYSELPSVEEVSKEVSEGLVVSDKDQSKWWEIDRSMKPRISKIWNPLVNLWRIPWSKEGLKKIADGDLISYSASGYVSTGVEGSFVPLKIYPGVNASLTVGAQIYVRGEFKITMLKENERYVRVKVTRMRSFGQMASAGVSSNEMVVLDGFVMFEKSLPIKVSDMDITVVPFKVSLDREMKKQYDIGYRFDLNDPQAEAAFTSAMKGNLKPAEDISKVSDVVTHLLSRDALEKRKTTSYQVGHKLIYLFSKTREKRDLWATIERGGTTTDVFKSSMRLAKSWSTSFGTGEKKNFMFTSVLDRTGYENGKANSFQLVTEGLYEDVSTSGREMKKYVRDVQLALGGRHTFPDLPLLVPSENSRKLKMAQYGRSSFYFGQYITQDQVMKFIMTDPECALEIATKSFGNDKGMGRRFFRRWMNLQNRFKAIASTDQLADALSELRQLFRRHAYAVHAMTALSLSLKGEELDYFITATNNSFGRIQFRGRVQTDTESLLQLADETVDFENRVGQFRPDLTARITGLKAVQLPDQSIKVTFNLSKDMNYLYFKLLRSSAWKKVKNMRGLVYVNKGRFKTGDNTLIIDPDSEDPLEQAIWSALTQSDYYTFQMSGSTDGKLWGRTESIRFKFEPIEVPEVASAI